MKVYSDFLHEAHRVSYPCDSVKLLKLTETVLRKKNPGLKDEAKTQAIMGCLSQSLKEEKNNPRRDPVRGRKLAEGLLRIGQTRSLASHQAFLELADVIDTYPATAALAAPGIAQTLAAETARQGRENYAPLIAAVACMSADKNTAPILAKALDNVARHDYLTDNRRAAQNIAKRHGCAAFLEDAKPAAVLDDASVIFVYDEDAPPPASRSRARIKPPSRHEPSTTPPARSGTSRPRPASPRQNNY